MGTIGNSFERAKTAIQKLGISHSAWYDWRQRGLLPPGIRLGARTVVYPSSEIAAVVAARSEGQTDDEIKALVIQLVAARQVTA